MRGSPLRPEEARAALTEAGSHSTRVRRADREMRWLLLLIGAVYLFGSGVASVGGRQGGTAMWLALFAIVIAGSVGLILLGLRLRAISRAGYMWFIGAVTAFILWNWIVYGVSQGTGWWAPEQPSYHFFVSEAIGVIPLVVAAWLIGRH